jgi:GNAT superfamily N-acetyltransferase
VSGTPRVKVRLADAHDAAAVFPLARDMATSFRVDEAIFAASFASLVTSEVAAVLVAVTGAADGEEGEEIVGYLLGFDHLAFYANGPVAYIEEVAVAEHRQGEGIGQLLMHSFEEWAARRSSVLITVATRRADGFYRARRYEETATLFRRLL